MYLIVSFFGTVGVILALLTIAILILRQKSTLIFGIYPRKGLFYHLKYVIALLVLKRLRRKIYGANDDEMNKRSYMATIDKPQPLSDNPKSYDVVSFMGANKTTEKLMITLERRRRGIVRAAIYLWLPEYGLLSSPNLPDMIYFTTDGVLENNEFRGSGFHIYPEQYMQSWHIKYEGKLRTLENKLLPVLLNLSFISKFGSHFNYNRDLSSSVIADSTAREAWNDRFYSMLKNIDKILETRTHYEQSGLLSGMLEIGALDAEKKSLKLEMKGFRDHSFGTERCLSSINRYVYFALFLNDDTSMVVGNLSQPSFFLSSLKVGYICTQNGVYKPITRCNFELYSYGEKGQPPQNQNFIVNTADTKYFVQIKVEDEAVRYVGGNWESKVYNQFVSCTVNGVAGQGLTEYLYRNVGGRPSTVSVNDPQWYRRIREYERYLSTGAHSDNDEVFYF